MAGLGVIDDGTRRNEAWWFAPDGRLATNYLKHFMAPPEREFLAGNEFPVNDIGGVRYGVAICKDMHFSSLGRGFGQRHARVMLVPAWDFDRDAEMAANMTKMRGVESGFSVVRSSRNGLLSITDAYGRVLAVDRSAKLPGTALVATVDVSAPMTDYLHTYRRFAGLGQRAGRHPAHRDRAPAHAPRADHRRTQLPALGLAPAATAANASFAESWNRRASRRSASASARW